MGVQGPRVGPLLYEPGLRARRHEAHQAQCERDAHQRHQSQQRGDGEHHHHHPDDRERGGQHLAERLLHALGHVVDVVGHPAEQVSPSLSIHIGQRESVDLVLDVGPQPAHGALHDPCEQVVLRERQQPAAHVEAERSEQHVAQPGEVDPTTGDAVDDRVGCGSQDLGAEHQQGHADQGEDHHRDRSRSLRAHQAGHPPDRAP